MRLTIPTLLIALMLVACDNEPQGSNVVKRPGQSPYTRTEDPALDRAYAKAKATYKDFIVALQNPKAGQRGFAVKKPFPIANGGGEHIWINEVSWDGSKFVGKINNAPVDTTAVKMGDKVTVTPEELTDWMYIDGKKIVGAYTLRILHYQQPAAEQKAFTQQTGLEVPPVDF